MLRRLKNCDRKSKNEGKENNENNFYTESVRKLKFKPASDDENKKKRKERMPQRVEMLARPNTRRLQSLWDEKCGMLTAQRKDIIKSAIENDTFLTPEQTEMYFQSIRQPSKNWKLPVLGGDKKELMKKQTELQERQKWLVNFSAQVAFQLCGYIATGQSNEMLVSNRLRSIADVVLERVAEILGKPKPTRSNPGRLARFMVAISDRIAVWIENTVYKADALEPIAPGAPDDEHMILDRDPGVCH